jgi:hypothetical protein
MSHSGISYHLNDERATPELLIAPRRSLETSTTMLRNLIAQTDRVRYRVVNTG